MKRTERHVDLGLYAALFKDIVAWDSNLRQELDRDLLRLVRTISTRGLSFLMLDMPAAGKYLDSCLSSGVINSERLPGTFGKRLDKGTREFLSCLFELIFDGSGQINTSVDPTAVFFLRQVLYLAKKVREDCSDAAISAEVESFRKVDACTRAYSLDWECDTLNSEEAKALSFLDGYRGNPDLVSDRDECPRSLIRILDQVSSILVSRMPELDWRELAPKHGTGATADIRTGTDKYQFKYWPQKLEGMFPFNYYGQSREDLHFEVDHPISSHEPPGRLLAVPKDLKGPRLITSEPTAHQFLQQGLLRWIRKNIPFPLTLCVDFKSQEPSRQMCLDASKTGDLATVDLSSASDRLSLWCVERMFRNNRSFLSALHACRTRWVVNSTKCGEQFFIKLKKFAGQGSAVTFPVQSICYSIIAISCILYSKGWKPNPRSIVNAVKVLRVFGDDIIMPSYAVHPLNLLMAHLGLKVNASKTHWQGYFRESCGMDAFKGVCVTPLYLRSLDWVDSPDEIVSYVDVCNNAHFKGLWFLADAMLRKIPHQVRKLIPTSDGPLGVLTLRTFQETHPFGTQERYCSQYQRSEVLGLTPLAKPELRSRETHQSLLQFFVEEPDPEVFWKSGYLVRVRFTLVKRWVPAHSQGRRTESLDVTLKTSKA